MVKKSKKKDLKINSGILHVKTSENNTIVTLTDEKGNKILGGGTGVLGYKGAKQNTPYAAEMISKHILKQGESLGLKEVGIVFRGNGMGRDGIFKSINEIGTIGISYIKENTGIQFGGCKGYRPKKM